MRGEKERQIWTYGRVLYLSASVRPTGTRPLRGLRGQAAAAAQFASERQDECVRSGAMSREKRDDYFSTCSGQVW